MSRIRVWPDGNPDTMDFQSDDPGEIQRVLARIGVDFEQWPSGERLSAESDEVSILKAYDPEIRRLRSRGGYAKADVVRLVSGTSNTDAMRAKFLEEHVHSEDEVRFFVEGSGAFYLHAADRIHQVICCAGDLLSVPANMRHWFDMGERPAFCAIRLFTKPEGWVAQFTGDSIGKRFPLYDGVY